MLRLKIIKQRTRVKSMKTKRLENNVRSQKTILHVLRVYNENVILQLLIDR